MQREVDTTRERLERLQTLGCADYLHMALLGRAEKAEAALVRALEREETHNKSFLAVQSHNVRLMDQRDAALARLSAPETMAWAVVGEDGRVNADTVCLRKEETEMICDPKARVIRVAIRVVEGD